MKKNILALSVAATMAFGAHASVNWQHYNDNLDAPSVITLPNGAVGDVTALTKIANIHRVTAELNHEQVTDNVWVLHGPAYAPVVIELDDGLIVAPTGEHAGDGADFRAYIREHISTKPIIGIIYDHNHYVAGTKTMLDGDDAVIVAHPDLNDIIMARSGDGQANAYIDEMQPHLATRANIHYGNLNPDEGPDAALVPLSVKMGHESAWIPATHLVEHGESFTIGGLEFIAYHAETDTKDTINVYIPEYEMVIANAVWPSMNMYTLRGDAYRDPRTWTDALVQIRDLEPKYVIDIGSGASPLKSKEQIQQTINAMVDSRNFVYDQAIRLTNLGVSPSQLKHHMPIPDALNAHTHVNNVYGQYETYPEAFPVQNHGYFSGQPHELHNLPNAKHAEYMIKLAGGVEATYVAWQEAMAQGEFLWAKELSSALYFNAPGNTVARQAFADTLRELGRRSEGTIVRNFYIAGARSLEGDTDVTLSGRQSAAWVEREPGTAVNYLRTYVNPTRATQVSGILTFDFGDEQHSLEIRNGIAEYLTNANDSGEVIKISPEEFGQYYVGKRKANQIASGKALELLNVFDEYQHIPMYPTNFDHLN
ncbi:alkyl sulfatase dimerization domain-containing protein [Vibrio sp. WXL103]|uniref:alkyl sulfatase dimerization domain-containing protein n=1 Tax=Vibrio sp. WXL103 TaxID=3450710 RepID=UPI003EC6F801